MHQLKTSSKALLVVDRGLHTPADKETDRISRVLQRKLRRNEDFESVGFGNIIDEVFLNS